MNWQPQKISIEFVFPENWIALFLRIKMQRNQVEK